MAAPHLTAPVRFARAIQSHRRALLLSMDEVMSRELTPLQRAALDTFLQVAELTVSALDPVSRGYFYKRKLNAE